MPIPQTSHAPNTQSDVEFARHRKFVNLSPDRTGSSVTRDDMMIGGKGKGKEIVPYGKRPRIDQSPRAARSLSPPGWRAQRHPHSGNVVQVRRMSGNASTDFSRDDDPSRFEFQVLSATDVQRFVDSCHVEARVQWNQLDHRQANECRTLNGLSRDGL